MSRKDLAWDSGHIYGHKAVDVMWVGGILCGRRTVTSENRLAAELLGGE